MRTVINGMGRGARNLRYADLAWKLLLAAFARRSGAGAPGRHSIFRFPLGVLDPPAPDCGEGEEAVDRTTRAALLRPLTRAELETPDNTPLTPEFWRTRLAKPDTLDSKHYVGSFRMRLISDVVIAANGLRELCGLPHLDFDSHDVRGAARSPTAQ